MSAYLDFLDKMADKYGVPRDEARAIYENETRSGRIVNRSPAGAIGHMQLMPGTAKELGVDPNDPYQNIEGGVRYYAQQRKRFGDPALAAAAYNAGPGRVGRLGRVPAIPETQDYVSRFMRQIGRGQTAPTSAISSTETQGTTPMQPTTGGLTAATQQPEQQPQDDLLQLQQELINWPAKREALRKQQFEQGKKNIAEMYAGPSQSQQLFALSQALLAPRKFKGLAGTLSNVTSALGDISKARKTAERQRAEALARLQESYQTGQFDDESEALKLRYQVAKERAEAGKPSRGTWSESEGKFVSPDVPSATKRTAVVDGFKVRQYTDGTLRLNNPDGSQSVYDINGKKLGDIPAGGAR